MMCGTLCPAGGLTDFPKWSKSALSVWSVLYLVVALIHLLGAGVGALSDDGAHLLSFKEGITDDFCEVLSDWNESDSYPCDWSGVKCDPVSLRVLELRIVGNGVISLNGVEELGVGDLLPCGLRGTLSPEIGKLSELQVLCLTFNWLSGELPKSIGDLRDLKTLDLQSNLLTGRLPSELGKLSGLEVLNLDHNRFHGHIPAEVSSCQGLRSLSLAGNLLSGNIPPSFGNLPLLESLSLSNNNLVGSIPNELTRGNCMLRHLNFSGTFLTANLPTKPGDYTRLASPRRLLLAGDGGGDESPSGGDDGGGHTNVKPVLVAAITAGCAIAVVLVFLGVMFQCSRHRHTRVPQAPPTATGRKVVVTFMTPNHNLTYDNVVRATGNFCIDNLIGSGGFGATYKAEVKPGLLVAVKRLAIGRFQGVQQFDTEIRTLGRIRHPNLVTLIGYHASEEEMFLIYNFFSHGNLETAIHFQKEEMNWKTRHSIALRIAEALAYLHDECIPRVLHRDIKPSNILLDENMNAHLSDFGLARLLGASETHATTDVAGTFGYVAPEYAMTCRVTDKADVYSYGVVLLELLTGKRALDPSFCEYGDGFNIVSWACLLIRDGQASQVFTVRLWELGPEKHLLETLKLAVLCTVEQLSTRPTMREVVDTLLKIRPM